MPPEATPAVETTTQTAPVETTPAQTTPATTTPVTTTTETTPAQTTTQTTPAQTTPVTTTPATTEKTAPVNQWPEQGFPDNWRDRVMIGVEDKDGKIKEMVSKLASPSEFPRALAEHTRQMAELTERQKGMIKIPGEKATPEEIAEYRKARGVAEKAEDIKVYRPEGLKETPEIKALEASFQKVAFEAGLTQTEADNVMKGYYNIETEASKAMDLQATRRAQETQNALKAEWGADYDANHEITVRALNHYFGKDMPAFLDLELKDGTRVGDSLAAVRGLVRMAKDWQGGAPMIDGVPADGIDLVAEQKKIFALMHSKPDEYASKPVQDRLAALQNALNRKNGVTEMRR